jgi:two-component system phosphate regulon sensor histidine kinase PhoR
MISARRTRLSTRFLIYYAVTFLVLIGLMVVIVDRSVRAALIDEIDETLEVGARLSMLSLPEDESAYQSWAEAAFETSGFRTTLIDMSGVVVADSHPDPSVLENHSDRPEVHTALMGEVGVASRMSESTGFEQRYLALPPQEGLVVRMSVPTRVIEEHLASVRTAILAVGLALGLLGVAVVAFLARRLARPITELTDQAHAVSEGATEVDVSPSNVLELDELGAAISTMAGRLGFRVSEAEEATATLQMVLDALPQGTILFDEGDRVAYANPAAAGMLGAIPADLAGLVPLQLQTAVREAREQAAQETRVVDHGGPGRRLRAVATPFSSDDRVLLLLVDITERERTDAIRRDFVANASHELKTPVSTIIAASEALQIAIERGDASAPDFADTIEASARRLDRMVTDLLDLSRLERDRPEMKAARLDQVVREEVERARPDAESRGLDLRLSAVEVTATVSSRDLATAVRNLLDNAIRYTPDGGSVKVKVGTDGADAMVTVGDTGEGIPTRDIERVFERFYRVDSARSRATGGTGLGLSIVKHVAESHGGGVTVISELGRGSTFTIRIPLRQEGETASGN